MYEFKKAKAVWGSGLKNQYNQFLGFYTSIQVESGSIVTFAVAALNKVGRYCNDCTLEPGLLVVEITDGRGGVLGWTSDDKWRYRELLTRRDLVETMSHSRGIVEYYDLDPDSFGWRMGEDMEKVPVLSEEAVSYLKRRAPYSTYASIPMKSVQGVFDMVPDAEGGAGFALNLARGFNKEWYVMLPEENCFLESLRKECEGRFTGVFRIYQDADKKQVAEVTPGNNPAALVWGIGKSELGFLDFEVSVEKACVVDIINSDHRDFHGGLKANTYAARYCLQAGTYHLTTFEPKLTRYVKMIFRTEGKVTVIRPQLLDDSYPDSGETFFECSDGELNAIYEAARRTLRLSTLDLFMDCPQRERGGWLCDSYFSAYAAWQLFGDLEVEKDFIENFMLTDPDVMWHGFFPEVYPSSRGKRSDPGIQNWSFWLLMELASYYERSGDRAFLETHRERVRRFVEGVLELRGESGLLEGMGEQFVDWSLSNRDFCLRPISIPNQCLAAAMLEKAGVLYGEEAWRKAGESMREIIEKMDKEPDMFGGGDGAVYEKGRLRRMDCLTESGIALELWSGFHQRDSLYRNRFVNSMGVSPEYRANPNIAKANLFIGLMLRFDVLDHMGRIDTLVKELKALYLPELKDGPGTLFENYNALSGCHGFNGAAGAMIINKVLGLGEPSERTKTIVLNPHPGELRWAFGSAKCSGGAIFLSWTADHEGHVLQICLQLPTGWNYQLELPFELCGWKVTFNGRELFV